MKGHNPKKRYLVMDVCDGTAYSLFDSPEEAQSFVAASIKATNDTRMNGGQECDYRIDEIDPSAGDASREIGICGPAGARHCPWCKAAADKFQNANGNVLWHCHACYWTHTEARLLQIESTDRGITP